MLGSLACWLIPATLFAAGRITLNRLGLPRLGWFLWVQRALLLVPGGVTALIVAEWFWPDEWSLVCYTVLTAQAVISALIVDRVLTERI